MIRCEVNRVGPNAGGYPCARFLAYRPQTPEVLPIGLHAINPSYKMLGSRRSIVCSFDPRDIICQVIEIPVRGYVRPVKPLTSSISVIDQSINVSRVSCTGIQAGVV
jgi:hypothetical protein